MTHLFTDDTLYSIHVFAPRDGGIPMAIVGGAFYNPGGDCARVVVAGVAQSSE